MAKRMYDINDENIEITKLIKHDSESINCQTVDSDTLNKIRNFDLKKRKMLGTKKIIAICTSVAACVAVAVVALVWNNISINNGVVYIPTKSVAKQSKMASSYSEIYSRMRKAKGVDFSEKENSIIEGIANSGNMKTASSDSASPGGSVGGSKNYSDTNEQTKDVHEADVVKTDGSYIYSLNVDKMVVTIVKVSGKKMEKVSTIKIPKVKKTFVNQADMYYIEDKLIIIENSNKTDAVSTYGVEDVARSGPCETIILTYNIKDREKPVLVSTNHQDGYYNSSRLNGDYIYTVSIKEMDNILKEDSCVPKVNGELISYDQVYLPKVIEGATYTVITSMNITKPSDFSEKVAVAGGVDYVYASKENIYIAENTTTNEDIKNTKYGKKIWSKYKGEKVKETSKNLSAKKIKKLREIYDENQFDLSKVTEVKKQSVFLDKNTINIIKYKYKNGKLEYVSDNKINGRLDDNLSMDEKDGYLRLVSTNLDFAYVGVKRIIYDNNGKKIVDYVDESYYSDESQKQSNNVYVLDSKLKGVAHIDNIAKNEEIYAARFMGDYGYFVTYENKDPLFTVDFSDIRNPKIIGKLKLPGFSDYLHFYNSNLLFGLGEETENNCLKMEMYNISKGKAKRVSKKLLKGFESSQALYDYKSILVNEEKNIIGFYASYYGKQSEDMRDYYLLYTYEKGEFKQLAKVKLGVESYDTRGLYIDDYFYIVTPYTGIKVLDLRTKEQVANIKF